MNINELDLNLLVVFDALMAEGKVIKAAKRIGLSQPALSNALSRLRTLMNDPLFVRTPKGMQPTPRARQLADPIRQALTLIQSSLQEHTEFDFTSVSHTFNVAMSDYCSQVILPYLLRWLKEIAPRIRFKVHNFQETELQPKMESGLIDLAVGVFIGMEAGFYQQKLFDESFSCIVSGSHSMVENNLTKKQYLKLKHILVSPRGTGLGRTDKTLADLGEKREIVLHLPNFMIVASLVENTELIATIPTRVAQSAINRFNVKLFKHPYDVPGFTVSQYWHAQNQNDPAIRWLRQSLVQLSHWF